MCTYLREIINASVNVLNVLKFLLTVSQEMDVVRTCLILAVVPNSRISQGSVATQSRCDVSVSHPHIVTFSSRS